MIWKAGEEDMDLITGHSYSEDPFTIMNEATSEFMGNPGTILFFSPVSVFPVLNELLCERFPNTRIFGATTMYSFFENRRIAPDVGTGTVIIGFGDSFECRGGVIEQIDIHPIEYAPTVKRSLEQIEEENTICLSFTTAFFGAEELVLDTLASVIGNRKIPVVGSSCGNLGDDRITYVSYNGEVYSSASLYIFIHNRRGKTVVLKQDMFEPKRTAFTATSVDLKKRIIYELDGEPAALQLAKQLHYELYELGDHLDDYALGRMVGEEIYSTDIGKITKEKGLEVMAAVYGGTRLCLMERSRYNACLSDIVASIRRQIPSPRFVLYINCTSLTKFYDKIKWLNVFSVGMGTIGPVFAGFSGYGEQLGRININKTLLAIAFE